jgi:hypothetical protein
MEKNSIRGTHQPTITVHVGGHNAPEADLFDGDGRMGHSAFASAQQLTDRSAPGAAARHDGQAPDKAGRSAVGKYKIGCQPRTAGVYTLAYWGSQIDRGITGLDLIWQ